MGTTMASANRIAILDSIRGGAAALVFLFHAGYLFTYSEESLINWHHFVLYAGTLGVNIFFILSGFLIFFQLYSRSQQMTRATLRDFAFKRMIRILPLFYFSLIAIVIFIEPQLLTSVDGWASILFNALFIRTPFEFGSLDINAVYWTLIIEIHFYILFPLFYYLFLTYKERPQFFLWLAGVGVLYRIGLITLLENPPMQLLRFTLANIDYFAFGMLGAYLYIKRKDIVERCTHLPGQLIALASFFAFYGFYDLAFLPTWSYVLAPPLLSIMTLWVFFSFLGEKETVLDRVLTVKPILFFGQISFSVYIWHHVIINQVHYWQLTNIEKFWVSFLLTLGLSVVTYYTIELYAIKKLYRRRLSRDQE